MEDKASQHWIKNLFECLVPKSVVAAASTTLARSV